MIAPAPFSLSFDVFCRVIDNFGDIGVCWRLAKQLAGKPDVREVRLQVDDLHTFARIEAAVDPERQRQRVQGVELVHWTDSLPAMEPHPVVIEAFGCGLPVQWVKQMAQRDSLWVNLEYLSAEAWVESCHGLPSIQADGVRKTFFFPGFTSATGGLLRETGLMRARDEWREQPELRWRQLEEIGMPDAAIQVLRQGGRQIFLFCYPNAPAHELLDSLAQHDTPGVIIVPTEVYPSLKARQTPALHIHEAPFVDQAGFDRLLWGSDLNFVRGEDSLVRALWAGKPMIWQPYEQDGDTHLIKLDAWLQRSPFVPEVRELTRSWNTRKPAFGAQLSRILRSDGWPQWQAAMTEWTEKLAGQSDLASSLIAFCTKQRRTG